MGNALHHRKFTSEDLETTAVFGCRIGRMVDLRALKRVSGVGLRSPKCNGHFGKIVLASAILDDELEIASKA